MLPRALFFVALSVSSDQRSDTPGRPPVPAPVGEQHGRAAQPEQAVGDGHAALVAQVHILCDVLQTHHQGCSPAIHLRIRKPHTLQNCSAARKGL